MRLKLDLEIGDVEVEGVISHGELVDIYVQLVNTGEYVEINDLKPGGLDEQIKEKLMEYAEEHGLIEDSMKIDALDAYKESRDQDEFVECEYTGEESIA